MRETDITPRDVAVRFIDEKRYFVSKDQASDHGFHLLKAQFSGQLLVITLFSSRGALHNRDQISVEISTFLQQSRLK